MPSSPLTWPEILILFGAGAVAGFMNVVAGGGSLLTLPALLFVGLPAPVANATNRISLILQNASASTAFRRGGRLPLRVTVRLALVALPGAAVGAFLALDVDETTFRRILAAILTALWAATAIAIATAYRPGGPIDIVVALACFLPVLIASSIVEFDITRICDDHQQERSRCIVNTNKVVPKRLEIIPIAVREISNY